MERLEYRTIDKSTWGDGPWQNEPDKVQFADQTTGFPCLIKRNPQLGNLCGYVGVSEGHPAFCSVPDVAVHGGITFSDFCQEGPEAETICHVPGPGEPDRVFWLGFDCAHGGDLSPGIWAMLRETAGRMENYPDHGETYRDIAYVEAECASLAAQLRDMA